MPFSYPKYNAAIAAKLANGDFYRYLVDWRPEHAFTVRLGELRKHHRLFWRYCSAQCGVVVETGTYFAHRVVMILCLQEQRHGTGESGRSCAVCLD